jgi:hypothetical protein
MDTIPLRCVYQSSAAYISRNGSALKAAGHWAAPPSSNSGESSIHRSTRQAGVENATGLLLLRALNCGRPARMAIAAEGVAELLGRVDFPAIAARS